MTSRLYEEILPGGYYLQSKSKKPNRVDMVSNQVQVDEDLNCHPKNITNSYTSHIKTTYNSNIATVLECSESLCDQEPETSSATLTEDRDSETDQLVILVDEKLSTRDKTESFKPSVLQVPCKNIKDYRETVKSANPATLETFPPQSLDPGHSMDQIEKERREVEEAIERYTQARIYASFENFLQDKKPCYVEKCGFNKVVSPDLLSASMDSSKTTEIESLIKESSSTSQHGESFSRSQMLLDDVCDEVYDRVNDTISAASCKSYLHQSPNNRHSNTIFDSSDDVVSAGCEQPFRSNYTGQVSVSRIGKIPLLPTPELFCAYFYNNKLLSDLT